MTATRNHAAPATDAGVEGNSRLTSSLGMVLLVMLAVEGATVLNVRGMLTLHMYLGLMLIPPVLLKSATTLYRFARYYAGSQPYVRRGPPHIVLRVLGPLVVLSSVVLLGTGLALIVASDSQSGTWLSLHQASFVVWLVVMSLHVLGHVLAASQASVAEFRSDEYSRGRTVRLGALVLVLLAGVGLATALWPAEQSASRSHFGHFHDFRRGDR
jgi:hypothetical protein